MDATMKAEIYRYYTDAKEKVNKINASYNNANKSGLADNEFKSMTNTIRESIKDITMGFRKVEEKLVEAKRAVAAAETEARDTPLRVIVVDVEMERAVAAAEQRKRARENINNEEAARNRARRNEIIKMKKGRNGAGGSNA